MARRSASATALWVGLVCLLPLLAAAQNPTAQIVLRWKEVAGATNYEIEIAKDAAFKDTVVREKTPTAGFRWKEIPAVAHYWRVRSLDVSGRQSPWSETQMIDAAVSAPDLIAPSSGARIFMGELRAIELAFEISQVIKAYRIEVAPDARFGQRLLERSVTASPVSFTAPAPGTYYWRISATDLKGRNTGFGEVRSFSVLLTPPRLLAPVEGLSLPWEARLAPLELKWSPGWAAARYQVEVQVPGGAEVKSSSRRPALPFSPSAAGRYAWRVRVEDAAGGFSEWSARGSFTIAPEVVVPRAVPLPPLEAPSVLTPTAGAVLPRYQGPRLSWSEVPRAARYEIQLAAGGGALEGSSQFGAGPSVGWAALDVGDYAWRVRALEADGAPGAWSERSEFKVVLPPTVRAEIESDATSLVADGKASTGLRVRLFDAAGAPVRGAPVRIEVSAGAVEPVVESDDGYRARYVSPLLAPAEGSARVLVRDRDFVQASSVGLVKRVERFALGARAGFNGNFAGPSSPQGGLELRYRTPVFGDRLGVSLRGSFHALSTYAEVPSVPERVLIDAQIFSTALMALYEVPFKQFRFLAGIGPQLVLARVAVGVERATRVVPGVQGLVGAGLRLGPVELIAEVGYAHGRVDDEGAVLGTGGLLISAGCLLWL